MNDPMERMIATALDLAGFEYVTDFGGGNPSGLDFKIVGPIGNGVEIEVKQFHSDRIAEQMSRAPDVIAVQGPLACALLAHLIPCRAALSPGSKPLVETPKSGSIAKQREPEIAPNQ